MGAISAVELTMKKFLANLGVFGFSSDTLSNCFERRYREPSSYYNPVSKCSATALHEQGDVVGMSGFEMLSESAYYQEMQHQVV